MPFCFFTLLLFFMVNGWNNGLFSDYLFHRLSVPNSEFFSLPIKYFNLRIRSFFFRPSTNQSVLGALFEISDRYNCVRNRIFYFCFLKSFKTKATRITATTGVGISSITRPGLRKRNIQFHTFFNNLSF